MNDAVQGVLSGWHDFYVITGDAAAALTGLQFIVQSLLASNAHRAAGLDNPEAGTEAFGSPTVVHFTAALIVSAIMCIPWPDPSGLRAALGILGTGALVYAAIVLRRTLKQSIYKPVFEDWLWHIILPIAVYTAILGSAALLSQGSWTPLLVIAAATLLLICIGIHNAWDTVTYLTYSRIFSAAPDAPVLRPAPGKHRKGRKR